jgi:hypothetical protein
MAEHNYIIPLFSSEVEKGEGGGKNMVYDVARTAVPLNRWSPAVPSGFTLA